jgi:hypothetical protein
MKTTQLILFAALTGISTALALDPPPDGGYPNQNTAEGEDALFNLGAFAAENTALGYRALYSATFCSQNTAVGTQALFSDTTGSYNVGLGWYSLHSNTTGNENVALGYFSLIGNTTGEANVAIGLEAMSFNTTGYGNVAIGPRSGGGARATITSPSATARWQTRKKAASILPWGTARLVTAQVATISVSARSPEFA